jgi:RNA polymerase subunit RPABC4/transcription elongation factor Spt4
MSHYNVVVTAVASPSTDLQRPRLGAYALRDTSCWNRPTSSRRPLMTAGAVGRCDEFVRVGTICRHNAEVCRRMGQQEKTEVWETLALILQNQKQYVTTTGSRYDGWKAGRGALGMDLLNSIMRYYEVQGDVQMLATIVCIFRSMRLNGATSRNNTTSFIGEEISLLRPQDDEKYDTFIRRYADQLYAWGLLMIRSEICKHLVRNIPESYDAVASRSKTTGAVFQRDHHPHGSAHRQNYNGSSCGQPDLRLSIVFKCPRCRNTTDVGTNYCRSCQDYAFRCALCESSVRGLFSVCDT